MAQKSVEIHIMMHENAIQRENDKPEQTGAEAKHACNFNSGHCGNSAGAWELPLLCEKGGKQSINGRDRGQTCL